MANSNKLHPNYERCKDIAISTYANETNKNQILINFKKKYELVINSPRTLDCIKDLHTLFKVLEKRSELSPTDIHVLEYVYSILRIQTQDLENHKKLIQKEGNRRLNSVDAKRKDVKHHASNNNTLSPYLPPRHSANENSEYANLNQQRLTQRVITEICTRVGASWKDFARYLKVRECIVHTISQDPRLPSNEAKTRAILLEYETQALPEELKVKLLKALKLTGRTDIHDDVQKLFLREDEKGPQEDWQVTLLLSTLGSFNSNFPLLVDSLWSKKTQMRCRGTPRSLLSAPSNPLAQLDEEDLVALPLITLFEETVNRIHAGFMLQTDGNRPLGRNIPQNDQGEFYDKKFVSVTLAIIMLMFLSLVVYEIYELISKVCAFLYKLNICYILWIMLYHCFKFLFLLVKEVILISSWFMNKVREKGLISTVLHCFKISFKIALREIMTFYKNDEIEEQEPPCPEISMLLSVGLTMYYCLIWLARNVYRIGLPTTIKLIMIKLIQSINAGYRFWVEPDVKTSLNDVNNIRQSLQERTILFHLASKISKFLQCLHNLNICFLIYYLIIIIPYSGVKNIVNKSLNINEEDDINPIEGIL